MVGSWADPDRAVTEFEARLDRSAFGGAARASYRLESAQEDAHFTAARNLLEKALRRLGSGNEDAAVALVRRALAIEPTLEHDALPAAVAAQMLLYTELADRHEAADVSWLGPVLDLLAGSSGAVRTELAGALDALAEGELSGDDQARVRAVVPAGMRLQDPLSGVDDEAERVAVVLGVLRLLGDLAVA